MPVQLIATGTFTSAGTTQQIPLRSGFNKVRVINLTQSATTQATGRGCKFEWQTGMAQDSAIMESKTNSTNGLNLSQITSGGISYFDTAAQTVGALKILASTYVTKANPAVVTCTAHGFSNGDKVRMINVGAMQQISGYIFTIASVTTDTFTLAYLDSSGFANAATSGYCRKEPASTLFNPHNNRIIAMTAANPCVVTFAADHGYSVGAKLRLHVPAAFGMVQADGLIGTVTAVNTTTNTVTLGDIDASAFTAFALPTSAVAAAGVTPAYVTPIGETTATVASAEENTGVVALSLAAGVNSPAGSAGDVIYWEALQSGYTLAQ